MSGPLAAPGRLTEAGGRLECLVHTLLPVLARQYDESL